MTVYTAPTIGPTSADSSQVRTGLAGLRSVLNGGVDTTDNIVTSEALAASKLRSGAVSQVWREGSDNDTAHLPVMVNNGNTELLGVRTNLLRPDNLAVRFYLHAAADILVWANASIRLAKAANLASPDTIDVQCDAYLYLDASVLTTNKESIGLAHNTTSQGAMSVNLFGASTSVAAGWHEVSVLLDFDSSSTTLTNESLVHLACGHRNVVVEALYR